MAAGRLRWRRGRLWGRRLLLLRWRGRNLLLRRPRRRTSGMRHLHLEGDCLLHGGCGARRVRVRLRLSGRLTGRLGGGSGDCSAAAAKLAALPGPLARGRAPGLVGGWINNGGEGRRRGGGGGGRGGQRTMRRAARCDGRRWQVIRPRGGGWWRHVATARACPRHRDRRRLRHRLPRRRQARNGRGCRRQKRRHSRGHAARTRGQLTGTP